MSSNNKTTPGQRFRDAVASEHPLQVVGAINANHALLAKRAGFKAIYLSGGGVAAGSLGVPDLGITGLDDVLTDVRRITDVCDLPLLVDVDTGFGSSAFNVARTVKSMIKFGAAAIHIEDQVGAKRCGHRPNKEIVSQQEMVDRIKAAVDARTDDSFVIMARTDALAVEGLESALERAAACIEAGADMVFPEAITELEMYKLFASRVKAPILANITEKRLHRDPSRRHPTECDRHHANPHGALRSHRLPHLRAKARRAVCSQEVTNSLPNKFKIGEPTWLKQKY